MGKPKKSKPQKKSKVQEAIKNPKVKDQRRVFLITYSKADLSKFPARESFSAEIVKAFGEKFIVEWACCIEEHPKTGGKHFHMAISFNRSLRFGPVKKHFLKTFKVSIHFKIESLGYVAAYRYICKKKRIDEVLHSEGHSPMARIRTPKTSKAMRVFSQNSASKKGGIKKKSKALKRLQFIDDSSESEGEQEDIDSSLTDSFDLLEIDENDEVSDSGQDSEEEEEQFYAPDKLKPYEVSEFLVKEGIRSRKVLLYIANLRAKNGERDLKAWVVGHTTKFVNELIDTTWEMEEAGAELERAKKTRMELLNDVFHGQCAESCNNCEWLRCAVSILQSNSINVYVFAAAMRNALKNGRGKGNNVLIVGPANCGKSFLLTPLQLVYKAFVNPSNTKYAWVTLEDKEVALLNDFRWSSECIDWKDFLLLLEGDTVNLPRPKNSYPTDLTVDRSNTVPFFSTSIRPFEYVGKGNSKDPGETAMMDTRWQVFTFTKAIENPRKVLPCRRCFADLIFKGHELDV